MCVIVGKYFPTIGWVAIKNRDRNYIPEISFKKDFKDGMEILYFWDDITQYCEGINSAGVGVLSASLMVIDDEKEIEQRSKTPSKDGIKIKNALKFSNIDDVVDDLTKNSLTGHTLVFDQENMFVIEGAWIKGKYQQQDGFEFRIHKLEKNQYVVRTNHGINIPWAGYQNSIDGSENFSRISSESRRAIAKYVAINSKTPIDIIDGLTKKYTNNMQLNVLRTSNEDKKMRTTSQIMIIPKENTMYVRPVQSHMSYNFWDLNVPTQKTWVEILSNRILYTHLFDSDQESPFNHQLTHIAK